MMKLISLRNTLSILFFAVSIFLALDVLAKEGYNYDTGSLIDVQPSDYYGRRTGEVEYFDYGTGERRTGRFDSVLAGRGLLYDYDSGESYNIEVN